MEAEIGSRRRRCGGEEAEPLLGDDEGDEDLWAGVEYEAAEVEHGVDVASSGVRHRHNVALGSCSGHISGEATAGDALTTPYVKYAD